VTLLAGGGVGSSAQSVTVAASNLVARSVNADDYLAADGTVPLTDKDALDAGTGTVHLTGGAFQLDGKIGSKVQLTSGTLLGLGSVLAPLDVAGGTVDPGENVGTLNAGPSDTTFHSGGTFNADLVTPDSGGGQHDLLQVKGNVDLGSATLTGMVDPGYVPQHGDSFLVIQARGNVTGRFGNPAQLTFSGVPLTVSYQPHAVALVVNHAPVGSPRTLTLDEIDPTFNGMLAATDADGDPITFTLGTAPAKGTVSIDPKTGAFHYTPSAEAEGDDSFTFVPNDGISDGNPVTVTVHITPVAEAPTLHVRDAEGPEGSAIPLDIQSALVEIDPSGPSDLLAITVSGVPGNVVLSAGTNQGNGTWALTPGQLAGLTLTSQEEGTFTLTVTATTTDQPGGTSASTTGTLQVSVADPAVVLQGPPSIAATEGSDTGLVTLATFTDRGGAEALADYTATIDWGDQSGPDTSAVISFSGGVFAVQGHHTYTDEGRYTLTVAVGHDASPVQTVTGTVQVADADVLRADPGATLAVVQGNTFTATVATFSDSFTAATAGDFSASVDWGDGTKSAAQVVGSAGQFRVVAKNAYTRQGSFPIVVTIGDDASGATPTVVNVAATVATDLVLTDTADRPAAFAGLSADERFVQALYLDELGRAGSKAELDGWVAQLHAPGGSTTAVASSIAQSPEGRDHLVKDWYFTFLGRTATGGEEQTWVNHLLQGESEETVLAEILGSSQHEFYQRAQTLVSSGTADQRYVQALYLLLLDRPGSADEVQGWVDALPGLGLQGVASAILHGQEAHRDLFAAYYNVLLHRPADVQEVDGWVRAGLDASAARVGIEGSPEFYSNG
jgi:hypothetical protein